jgi:hypothetical protein
MCGGEIVDSGLRFADCVSSFQGLFCGAGRGDSRVLLGSAWGENGHWE